MSGERSRIRVDFNRVAGSGQIKGALRRADGPLRVGEQVVAYEAGDPEMEFQATVTYVDPDTGAVLLDINTPDADDAAAAQYLSGTGADRPDAERLARARSLTEHAALVRADEVRAAVRQKIRRLRDDPDAPRGI